MIMKEEHVAFLSDLSSFAIESRYGDYRRKLSEIVDKKAAAKYFDKTIGIFRWLRKTIK